MVTGLSHVSIAVPSLEHAATEIAAKLGLTMGKITANEEQGIRLAYVELGNARIEFMEPMHPTSPVAKFLERNPRGGIHHFCLAVDDVDAA
ncbi:MAG: VOC family protein, partial [Alphaproteobacteria bacterium]